MLSIEFAEIGDVALRALIPIVGGALVAALTALVKNAVERRDARKQAERRLALASARTEFADLWYETCLKVHTDDAGLATVSERTKRELESAYIEAHDALEKGKSTIEEDRGGAFVRSLRLLLALGPYENRASYIVGGMMYVGLALVVGGLTVNATETLDADESVDLLTLGASAVTMLIILRVLAQIMIFLLEKGPPTQTSKVVVASTAEFDAAIDSFESGGFRKREMIEHHHVHLLKTNYGRPTVHAWLAIPSFFFLFIPNLLYLVISLMKSEHIDLQLRADAPPPMPYPPPPSHGS